MTEGKHAGMVNSAEKGDTSPQGLMSALSSSMYDEPQLTANEVTEVLFNKWFDGSSKLCRGPQIWSG